MNILRLTNDYAERYTEFLCRSKFNQFFQSNLYRLLLKKYTQDTDYYILAIENNEIIAAFPLFIKQTPLGNCINSLP